MATYTAGDQINRALRLLGVLAEGETPSASESADALMALNQMLDSWSTEQLSVFTTTEQVFTWPSGQATRTLGPGGNFVGLRPIALDASTYYVVNGISYPLQIVTDAEYNEIVSKNVTSPLPMYLRCDYGVPNASMTLYPVPSQAIEIHFVSPTALAEPATTGTTLAFPPGYMRAFAYCLALEIAPEFGVEPSRDVRRIATTSKRDLKRINDPYDLMSVPLPSIGGGIRFNIYTGG